MDSRVQGSFASHELVQIVALVAYPVTIDLGIFCRGNPVCRTVLLFSQRTHIPLFSAAPDINTAAARAARANRTNRLQIPDAALIEEVLRQKRPGGAYIDYIVGIGIIEGDRLQTRHTGMTSSPDDAKHVGARDFAGEPNTATAQDAAFIVQRDTWTQFEKFRFTQFGIAGDRLGAPVLEKIVLHSAFTGLIADAAISGMV